MKTKIIAIAVILILISGIFGCSSAPTKKLNTLRTPDDIQRHIKFGMTLLEVNELVDMDYLTQYRAFAVVNFNKLEFVSDTVKYELTKNIDSPYYGWLLFGVIVSDLDPALIGFNSNDTVDGVIRISFTEAQRWVEYQSGRPFRR